MILARSLTSRADEARRRRLLFAALALALALRAGFGLTRGDLTASSDERSWNGVALAFQIDGLLHPEVGSFRPPLYPLLVAAIYSVHGHTPAAVRLWQAVLGTATCALLYAVGCRVGGQRVGLIAAGLAAAYPLFVFFSAVLMVESLLILLTVAALLLALRFEASPSPRNAAALGAALGLGALCKPVVLAWVPFLLWGWWRRSALARPARSGRLATALGAIAVVIAPWAVRNAVVQGYFVPVCSNLGTNLVIGNEPGADGGYRSGRDYLGMVEEIAGPEEHPVARDRLAAREALRWIAADPVRSGWLAGRKLLLFWSPVQLDESRWRNLIALLSSGPLLVAGLWGTWRLRGRPEAWVIGTLALSLSLVHAVFFSHIRFRLPVDAALMVPASLLLQQAWCRWRRGAGEPPPG